MKILTQIRSLMFSSLLCGVALLCCAAALAQYGGRFHAIRNVVLVHGAWANGSSWSKVIPLLVARGLQVTAVEIPLTSLADDVATVQRALDLETQPVLLVGHSYGGAVITQVGNHPNVAGLLYVAAYAPDDGESALSLANAYPTPVGKELRPDPSMMFYKLSAKGIYEDFAQDLSPVEKLNLFVTQGPTAGAALGSPISGPAWRSHPTWFIVAAQDRIISPRLEAMEAARMKATTITLNTNHVAMLSEPIRVAEFIARAADSGGQ